MYYVNKIVGWLLSPLGIMFLGLGAGWILRAAGMKLASPGSLGRRMSACGGWLAGMSLAFFWVMGLGVTSRFLGLPLESPWVRDGVMHGSIEGIPDADAIIVLGGGVGSHEKCHAPELFSGADRVWQGAKLYKAKKDRIRGLKVFCTGGGVEYATMPMLIDLGVPREAIWFSEDPRNTEEEARLIRSTLNVERPRVLLVTSAWHMSRAKMLFERAGFDVVPAPTDFEVNFARERKCEVGDFFPSAEALARNSYVVKEWIALFGYRMLRR